MKKRETNRAPTQYSKEKPFAKGVYHRTQMCAHTPGYLALGTSSTGPEAVCVGSTLGVLHLPP